jgi:hypothetical protein
MQEGFVRKRRDHVDGHPVSVNIRPVRSGVSRSTRRGCRNIVESCTRVACCARRSGRTPTENRGARMNARFLIPIMVGTLFTLSAQAHDCSGGTDGGMDATGNQCNVAPAVATDISTGRPTPSSARSPTAETSKAASGNKSASDLTVVTREAPARSRSKPS